MTAKCQAKNPATCPYHGNVTASNSLISRVRSLATGHPVHFTEFSPKATKLKATIQIEANNKQVKQRPVEIEIEAKNYEELVTEAKKELAALELRDLKSGYVTHMYLPSSDTKNSVSVKHYASTQRDRFDDETITGTGVTGMKQEIAKNFVRMSEANTVVDTTINQLKDSRISNNIGGAKAIALLEAMNEFNYFRGKYASQDVTAAFQSITDKTSEYTNRPYGIRVWMNYNNSRELTQARFSLDNPQSSYNTFSQKDVDKINHRLEAYFRSFA